MNLFGWTAIFALFGTVSLFIYLTFRRTELAIQRGREAQIRLEINPNADDHRIPWILRVHRIGLLLLPLIAQLIDLKRYGIDKLIVFSQKRLVQAGYGNRVTPVHFLLSTVNSLMIGGGSVAILSILYFDRSVSMGLIGMILGGIAGACFPLIIVTHHANTRIGLIEKRLPFAIEFMLLAMEASSSFPAAIETYCEQIPDDPLAEELATTLVEVESGLAVLTSLTRLSDRLNSQAVSAFVLSLNTGLETGQPIKAIMRTQADTTRQSRFQNAEEIAKKAGSQALFPLLLTMISIMLLLIGPMLLKLFSRGIM